MNKSIIVPMEINVLSVIMERHEIEVQGKS